MHRLNATRLGSCRKSSHKYLSLGAFGHVRDGIIEFVLESTSKYPFEVVCRDMARLGIEAGNISHKVEK